MDSKYSSILNVLATVLSRYFVAFLNLLLVFINARALGVEIVGLAAVILASMNLAVIFNSIFCGSTITYFMNKYGLLAILIPAYVWSVIGSLLAAGIMAGIGFFPPEYFADVQLLAMLNSLIASNTRFLLGYGKIRRFNNVYVLQGAVLFLLIVVFYYVMGKCNMQSYFRAMYLSNLIALLASFYYLRRELRAITPVPANNYPSVLKEMFVYGIWGNVDNLAETLSGRLNYFFVQHFVGFSGVGMLDSGTKVAESVWHISRAVGYIANGEVAGNKDKNTQRTITFRLLKWTFLATASVMVVILCIPEKIYTDYLFTPEFKGVRNVIFCLSPGIVALACNTILSQYFIASGNVRYSAYASCAGLAAFALAGNILVPLWGVNGGAVATSIAFCLMLVVSALNMMRCGKVGIP